MFLTILRSTNLNMSFGLKPLYSAYELMTPPALATKSGMMRTPFLWKYVSTSLDIGMFEPSTMIFALTFVLFALVIRSGIAAVIKMSASTLTISALGRTLQPGYAVTVPFFSLAALSFARSMPSLT